MVIALFCPLSSLFTKFSVQSPQESQQALTFVNARYAWVNSLQNFYDWTKIMARLYPGNQNGAEFSNGILFLNRISGGKQKAQVHICNHSFRPDVLESIRKLQKSFDLDAFKNIQDKQQNFCVVGGKGFSTPKAESDEDSKFRLF